MIIDCPKCNQYVEVAESGGYDYPAHQNGPGGRYRLVSCGICRRPMVVCQENLGNLADGDIWDQPFRVFPEDENFINPEWPAEIQNAYHEAVGCFKAHSYTATVIMCRKIIDGLCTLQGVNERNLDLSLKKLRDNGVIEVIIPFITAIKSRAYAASANFCAGVIPPNAILGRSLLYVHNQLVA